MPSQTKKPKRLLFITVAKFLLVLMVLVYLLIWSLSPVATRHFAQIPLQEMGLSLSENSSVRYNPFTSTLTINDLQFLDQSKHQTMSVENAEVSIHLHRLLLKQLYFSEFLFKGVKIEIIKDHQALVVAGVDFSSRSEEKQVVSSPEQKGEDSPSNLTLLIPQLRLENVLFNVIVDGTSQTFFLNELRVTNTSLSQIEQQISLSIQGLVNQAPLMLRSDVILQSGQGSFDSIFSLEQLDLQKLSPIFADLGIGLAGELSAKGGSKVNVTHQDIIINSEQMVLSLNELDLTYSPWIVESKSDVFTVNNLKITALQNGEIQSLAATISTQLSHANVGLQNRDNSVVNWERFNFTTDLQLINKQPSINIEQVDIRLLNLSDDRTLTETPPVLSVGQLSVSDMGFYENHLNINTVSISGLNTDIHINPDKSIVSMLDTSALTPESEDKATSNEDVTKSNTPEAVTEQVESSQTESTSLTFALRNLLLTDAANIHIRDQSVSPVFEQNITIETFRVGLIDSRDNTLKTPFELVAKDDSYLKIVANGHVRPLAEKLNALVTANISELDLPSVSPYIKDGLGFEMKTGQLDLGIEVTIQDDQIDGETKLFLRGVDMASADEVEQGTIKEGKAMPLNMALGLLKDEQGNIDLGVPLRGDVAEPSFGVESFLGLVLKKAAMSQAKSYLMNTFVPYASVVSVALSGAEYLLKVKFEPLVFQKGEVELTEENQQYLSELVLLMKDKPELQLKTCAIGTYADLNVPVATVLNTEQKASLKAMGSERQNNLKRYLIEQQITSSRILYCAPELDTAEDALPRIELKTD